MDVYPRGAHGLDLAAGVCYGGHGATRIPHTAQWSAACEAWLHAGVL
jgi:hypothetical protein